MDTVAADSLKANSSFTGDLILDSSFLLLPRGADVTESLIKALKQWNVDTVLCDGARSLDGEIDENLIDLEGAFDQPPAQEEKISLKEKLWRKKREWLKPFPFFT